ncbi:MAG: hypothetical protein FJ271_32960 [Planctomycetes bacterium]|nr:hypothetical protein [Planctomycetota bacterium]
MYFEDLTPYSYHRSEAESGAVNVGWLGADHPFASGTASVEFLDRLFVICRDHVFKMHRGFHVCEFCPNAANAPLAAIRIGNEARLGFGEIRVRHQGGKVFAAPTLIYHYVADHQYLPPREFIEAVLLGDCLVDHARGSS